MWSVSTIYDVVTADIRSLRRQEEDFIDSAALNTVAPMASLLERLSSGSSRDLSLLGQRARNSPSLKSFGSQDTDSSPPVYGPTVSRQADSLGRVSYKRAFVSPFVDRTISRRKYATDAVQNLQHNAREDPLSIFSASPDPAPLNKSMRGAPVPQRGRGDARSKSKRWDYDVAAGKRQPVRPIDRLFIGNLPPDASEQTVRKLFSPYEAPQEVTVARDGGSGRSKGFAYMTFASVGQAQRALSSLQGVFIDGCPLHADFSQPHQPCPYCYEVGHAPADCPSLASGPDMLELSLWYEKEVDDQEATTQPEPLTQMFMHYTLSEDHCGGNDVVKGNILARLGARSEVDCFTLQNDDHLDNETSTRPLNAQIAPYSQILFSQSR